MLLTFDLKKIFAATLLAILVSPAVSLAAAPARAVTPVFKPRASSKVRLGWLAPSSRTPADIKLIADIPYTKDDNEDDQTLDLFLPETRKEGAPVIVWIHGGAWRAGDKQWGPFRSLTAHGYAVASINYRLKAKRAVFPAQLHDCKQAIAWIRDHAADYNLDADRIGVWGASAGGHLAALLGTTDGINSLDPQGIDPKSTKVQAVCDWYGPADLSDVVGRRKFSFAVRAVSRLLGGNLTQKSAMAASPLSYVSADDPPFLIMHGDRDRRVPVGQSEKLYAELCRKGVPATLLIAQGEGHGLDNSHHEAVIKFFDKHLR